MTTWHSMPPDVPYDNIVCKDKENAIRAGILGRQHQSSQELLLSVIT
jgi:hypothetical protein